MNPSTAQLTIQPLKSVLTITENLIFPGFLSLSIFFIIFKFHDICMTGKAKVTFPGAVGTLSTAFTLNSVFQTR